MTARQRAAFSLRYADEIEAIEDDFHIKSFQGGSNALRSAPRPPRRGLGPQAYGSGVPGGIGCDFEQSSLTFDQWNLDRATYPAERADEYKPDGRGNGGLSLLDGIFAPPDCLCGRGVVIYMLDTGVRTTHEDFAPASRVDPGWNFVGCSGKVQDESGHGTHTAGTALGRISGVAKCASLVPVQILDWEGKGKSSSILSALDWVADHDAGNARKVVSMSVGGPRSEIINGAVREMVAMGIPIIAAAGNEGEDANGVSPASESLAITVGSTSCPEGGGGRCTSDAASGFSNFGALVDVYAPGDQIRSAWMTSDNSYKVSSGTSMAAPLVAGAVALYLEKFPAATCYDVANAIGQTVTPVTGTKGGGESKGGMLNMPAMLKIQPQSTLDSTKVGQVWIPGTVVRQRYGVG